MIIQNTKGNFFFFKLYFIFFKHFYCCLNVLDRFTFCRFNISHSSFVHNMFFFPFMHLFYCFFCLFFFIFTRLLPFLKMVSHMFDTAVITVSEAGLAGKRASNSTSLYVSSVSLRFCGWHHRHHHHHHIPPLCSLLAAPPPPPLMLLF